MHTCAQLLHIHMCTWVYTYTHRQVHTHAHIYTYACTTYIHIYICIHLCTYICTLRPGIVDTFLLCRELTVVSIRFVPAKQASASMPSPLAITYSSQCKWISHCHVRLRLSLAFSNHPVTKNQLVELHYSCLSSI